jgi:hypothetical protein
MFDGVDASLPFLGFLLRGEDKTPLKEKQE